MLREKSSFERQNVALDQLTRLMEGYDNRLPLKSGGLPKGYIEGRHEFCLKYRSRCCGQEFHVIVTNLNVGFELNNGPGWRRFNDGLSFGEGGLHRLGWGDEALTVCISHADKISSFKDFEAAHREVTAHIDDDQSGPVFVLPIDEVKTAQVAVPSALRVCSADQFNGIGRKKLFQFCNLGFVFVDGASEWERDPVVLSPVHHRDCGQNLVQGVAQVLENITDLDSHRFGNLMLPMEAPNFLSAFRIYLGFDFAWVCLKIPNDSGIEFLDFGICPFDFGVKRNKRLRFHDIESIMAKNDDLTGTKNLMGALNPKPKHFPT